MDEDESTSNESSILTCAERYSKNATGSPYDQSAETFVIVLRFLYYFTVMMLGVTLNFLVIIVVARTRKLQTRSFIAALQVVVLDLFLAIVFPISSISNMLADDWLFGWHICVFFNFIFTLSVIERTVLMLIVVIDRFLSIFCPFIYLKQSNKIVVYLTVLSWIINLTGCVVMLPGILDCYSLSQHGKHCLPTPSCSKPCSASIYIYFGSVWVSACFVPVFFYSIIFWKYKKLQKTIAELASLGANEAGDLQKREFNGIITFFLLFLSAFLLTFPSHAAVPVANVITESEVVLYSVTIVVAGIDVLPTVADPLIILHNKVAKEALSKLKKNIIIRLM